MLPKPFPFENLPTLESKRLKIAPLTSEHLQSYHQLCSEKETMKSYGLKPHSSMEETQKTLDILDSWFQAKTAIRWGIFTCDNRLIGDIGYWQFDILRHRAEMGMKICRHHQGQGFAKEALATVIDFGFTKMQLSGLDVHVAQSNKPSIALVEKLGFYRVGIRPNLSYSITKDCWQDMIMFSINQKDWVNNE